MNENNILFHRITWFLRENETKNLFECWEIEIKEKIINGYLEGEFEVDFNNINDSLIWKINRTLY
ncbi:MAG: hypothetical protein A2033_02790 [Bacteroidetes bacterium GWA2_31_9]|nr:MAG: hypothetical protein A2033_02790 [Bacteroidetes bacterium GWA2_31_9]